MNAKPSISRKFPTTPKRRGEQILAELAQRTRLPNHDRIRKWLNAGADLSVTDSEGNTSLLHAASGDQGEMVRMLVDAGATVEHCNKKGINALRWSIIRGQKDSAGLLIDRGADITARDQNNYTPFMHAVAWNRVEIARKIADAPRFSLDAQLDETSKHGRTAMDIAQQKGFTAMMDLIASLRMREEEKAAQRHRAQRAGLPVPKKIVAEKRGQVRSRFGSKP